MARRTAVPLSLSLTALLLSFALCPSSALAQPVVQSVVSRLSHGGTIYDVALPQSGAGGIECRTVAAGLNIVVTFDKPVTAGAAAITVGKATVGAVSFTGGVMSIPLTAVTNAQAITLTLSNVIDNAGGTLPSAPVSFRVLEGDINGSGNVTVGDVNFAQFLVSLAAINYSSFRADINLNGFVNVSDVNYVKSRFNTIVAGGAAQNTAPTISNIADQSTPGGTALAPVSFTVGDAESGPAALYVSATSSDTTLIPNANISISGSGASRAIGITPALDANSQPLTGTATITVKVNDGVITTIDTFLLTVGTPQKLYVTSLRPEDDATITSGAGSATLLVDAAETQAVLRLSYSNLTTNRTGAHIHGPADPGQTANIIYDIDIATPQADGSYLWVFQPAGITSVQDIRDALHSGRLYLNIHSAKYPNGEIRGHFNFAAGSTTFTPPLPPPALPGGTPTDQNAARFLLQATFGPAPDDTTDTNQANHTIAAVKSMGFNNWLDSQFNTPPTLMKPIIEGRIIASLPLYSLDQSNITDVWWYLTLKSPDQLRQRIAFAYSEIFVVSRVEEAISGEPLGLASYHDMLATDAFANFRTLLEDVTLHPIMGQYLNMRGNKKPVSPTFTAPNENYAREILQLFTIGLNAMHPDGTLKLDATGLPIPTYDQNTIQNFAHIFTGWDTDTVGYTYSFWDTALVPPAVNTTGKTFYVRPMTVRSGNHSNNTKALLNGLVITGLTTYSTATATAELDQALDNIFNHPNVGPFICRRLIQRLVTSNPSPAYIYRTAEVFRDNGQGVRGDMKAVIKAILTDYEARTTDLLGNEGYGRLKEPLLRTAQVIRAFHPISNGTTSPNTQYWRLGGTDTDFLQTPYRSPTVFNFFDPDYSIALTLVNPKLNVSYVANVTTPEMQITNENTTINTINLLKKGIVDNTGFVNLSGGSTDVRLNMLNEQTISLASTGDNLVAYLNKMLMAGQLPTDMTGTLKTYYSSIPTPGLATDLNAQKRARGLIYLVAASPQFAVQK
ncbi:MAG: hypothetical protein JWN40_5887 [Phycisphaerales bacterium]|nr:hypothetical protein [Phycisphaerales bacterium]